MRVRTVRRVRRPCKFHRRVASSPPRRPSWSSCPTVTPPTRSPQTLGFGPRHDMLQDPECRKPKEKYYWGDLNIRARSWVRGPPPDPWRNGTYTPYASSSQILKTEQLGFCPAIAQGRIAGIDMHSAEHVVYIRPTNYLKAEGDEEGDYYEGSFLCFAAIRLPYEAGRISLLNELSRGILLVTADRAAASAEAGPAEAFFSIVGLLKNRWEGESPPSLRGWRPRAPSSPARHPNPPTPARRRRSCAVVRAFAFGWYRRGGCWRRFGGLASRPADVGRRRHGGKWLVRSPSPTR